MVKLAFEPLVALVVSIIFVAFATAGPSVCLPHTGTQIRCSKGDDKYNLIRVVSKSGDKIIFRVGVWTKFDGMIENKESEFGSQSGCHAMIPFEEKYPHAYIYNCRLLGSDSEVNCNDFLLAYPA